MKKKTYYIHIGLRRSGSYIATYTTMPYETKKAAIKEAELLADMIDPGKCKDDAFVFITEFIMNNYHTRNTIKVFDVG